MALFDTIRLSRPPMLPENLLHPTHADAKALRQRALRTLARRVSRQKLPSQIVIVWSRHIYRGNHRSYPIVTLKTL
jgi:hypothetical protein